MNNFCVRYTQGQFILVSDSLTDGGFLIHHYITQALQGMSLFLPLSFVYVVLQVSRPFYVCTNLVPKLPPSTYIKCGNYEQLGVHKAYINLIPGPILNSSVLRVED